MLFIGKWTYLIVKGVNFYGILSTAKEIGQACNVHVMSNHAITPLPLLLNGIYLGIRPNVKLLLSSKLWTVKKAAELPFKKRQIPI